MRRVLREGSLSQMPNIERSMFFRPQDPDPHLYGHVHANEIPSQQLTTNYFSMDLFIIRVFSAFMYFFPLYILSLFPLSSYFSSQFLAAVQLYLFYFIISFHSLIPIAMFPFVCIICPSDGLFVANFFLLIV